MNGIILAAGRGKRLGRLTRRIPKPLLPINGIPIIRLIINKLKKLGINKIGINLYYKADIMKNFLKDIPGLKLVKEDYLSGTGGALMNFKDFVTNDFLIHNCDVISDIDLKKLIMVHKKNKPLATIALVKNYKTNRVRVLKNRILRFYKKRCEGCFTYTGIAVLSKRIFQYFPEGKKIFSLTEVYNNAIENGEILNGIVSDASWYDIGTPEAYHHLNMHWDKKSCQKGKNL